ncbi:MAG: hypothetical protein ACE5IY_08970, partial [bacterium]
YRQYFVDVWRQAPKRNSGFAPPKMRHVIESMKAKASRTLEEKIALSPFQTSEALKNEIGLRVRNRIEQDWDFVKLASRGPYLLLIFKQGED